MLGGLHRTRIQDYPKQLGCGLPGARGWAANLLCSVCLLPRFASHRISNACLSAAHPAQILPSKSRTIRMIRTKPSPPVGP
jgi:hypothetical protein